MIYSITNKYKKTVQEHLLWQKEDMVIRVITGFRWGKYVIEANSPPTLNVDYQFEAINMNDVDGAEMEYLEDGWFSVIEFPDAMAEMERDRLQAVWDEDSFEGFEEEGWINYDTEVWFEEPIEINVEEKSA